jgi:amino-acid N-acetyltransferase
LSALKSSGRPVCCDRWRCSLHYRGRGLAQALVARIVAHAHARGIVKLYLLTTTAEKFFERLGFAMTERSAVPSERLATEEFQSLCLSTDVCMTREIFREARSLHNSSRTGDDGESSSKPVSTRPS